MTETDYQKILSDIKTLAGNKQPERELQQIADFIHYSFPLFDWVGFYLVADTGRLLLGPFCGEPTEHVEIAFGQGICGQAASLEKTFVVPDVSLEANYLSCSVRVKSEIVLPIFSAGKFVAELDIDSHTRNAFSSADQICLERVCEMVSPLFNDL